MATSSEEKPRLLGIRAAAEYLGISEEVMRGAVIDGQVESVTIGQRRKVSTIALDRLLQRALQIPDQSNG